MKIEISNRYRKSEKASEFLNRNRRKLPAYRLTNLMAHNGIVIEVSDEDADDMVEAIGYAGFICAAEEADDKGN